MGAAPLLPLLPPAWSRLAKCKGDFYEALADRYTGLEQLRETMAGARNTESARWTGVVRLARSELMLRKAVKYCKEVLPENYSLVHVLEVEHTKSKDLVKTQSGGSSCTVAALEQMLPTKPAVAVSAMPCLDYIHVSEPGSLVSCHDVFYKLGPLSYYNANISMGPARLFLLNTVPGQGFGFTIGGTGPLCIFDVVTGSTAAKAGVKPGLAITRVNDVSTVNSTHDEVVALLKQNPLKVSLYLQGETRLYIHLYI